MKFSINYFGLVYQVKNLYYNPFLKDIIEIQGIFVFCASPGRW